MLILLSSMPLGYTIDNLVFICCILVGSYVPYMTILVCASVNMLCSIACILFVLSVLLVLWHAQCMLCYMRQSRFRISWYINAQYFTNGVNIQMNQMLPMSVHCINYQNTMNSLHKMISLEANLSSVCVIHSCQKNCNHMWSKTHDT